jgi:hypothetical protein
MTTNARMIYGSLVAIVNKLRADIVSLFWIQRRGQRYPSAQLYIWAPCKRGGDRAPCTSAWGNLPPWGNGAGSLENCLLSASEATIARLKSASAETYLCLGAWGCNSPRPPVSRAGYDAFAVVAVRMSALRLSAAIRPSMPSFFRTAANSERRVATSLIAPSR